MISRRRFAASAASACLAPMTLGSLASAAIGRRCEQNLRAIHDAVTAYRKSRGRLPDNLTALAIEKFIDSRLLICPVHGSRGTNSPSQLGLKDDLGDDFMTLYIWEYPGGESEHHERQRQMGAGDWVPIVRCREHTVPETNYTQLNLSLGGAIYRSGTDWEYQLRNIVPYTYLKSTLILGADPFVPLKERIRKRLPGGSSKQIDLGVAYNVALEDPWMEGWRGEGIPELLDLGGTQQQWTIGSISFELRGAVQLEGRGAAAVRPDQTNGGGSSEARFPFESSEVEADLRSANLHLLCGVIGSPIRLKPEAEPPQGKVVGRLIATDVAGQEFILDLKYGVHVVCGDTLADPDGASLVWVRPPVNPGFTGARSVSHVVWHLGETRRIRKIRFEASDSEYYPFLIAITAE